MPLYEYKCHKCGKKFEVIQKFSDEPLHTHPECGGEVEKLFSAPAFHLKGTGWYATDYAKKGAASGKTEDHKTDDHGSEPKKTGTENGEAKPAAASESSGAADSSSSTESKPAATESKPAANPAPSVSNEK